MNVERPLRILLGPWDKSLEWLGQVQDADIICFGQDAPLPYRFHQDTMMDLLNRLPEGWEPDVFVSWQPHLYAAPEGWHLLNKPSFAVIVDWQLFGLLDGKLDWLRAFDGIFLDRGGVNFLRQQGFENIWHFLPSSFDPDRQIPDPNVEKVFDISFAGALTHPIHRARSRWLYKVADTLADRYKVAFFDWSLKPDEYAHILKQSKIVFNYTYRGELNIRCYEALGAGALLFLEKGNLDVTGYFEDGVHYVGYNEDNFEEKMTYYLTHKDAREEITNAGWEQVQKHTNAAHLGWLVSQIEPLLTQPRKADISAWSPQWQGVNHIIDFYTPMTPARANAAHTTWDAMVTQDESLSAWLEIARASVDFRLATFQKGEQRSVAINSALTRLRQAISLQPDWVWPHYCLGQLFYSIGQKDKAKETFQKAVELLRNDPEQAVRQFGPYLPYSYDHFMVAWLETNIQCLQQQADMGSAWATLLESRCQEMVGKIYQEQGQFAMAQQAVEQAITLRPDIGAYYFQLAKVADQQNNYQTALTMAQQTLEIDALNFNAWILTANLLVKTKKFQDCLEFCEQKLNALAAFPNQQNVVPVLKNLHRQAQIGITKPGSKPQSTKSSQAPNYYQFSRPEIRERVPQTARRILDVGCAAGALGKALKDRQPCEVTGIEYVPEVADQACTVLDKVYSGDVNEIALTLPKNYFDAIIFADVLEHLPDPAITLERLLPTLSPNGKIIISIPNVRHWSVVKGLLEGQWEYEEAGLLDRTHLRFFTRNSFEKLLSQVGLKPISVGATRVNYPSVPDSIINSLQQEGLNVSTLAQESQVYQWLYVAEPISASSATPALTSIIILTHNQLEHTKRCLQSIQDHTPEPHELIIVDNGSTDGTRDYLRRYAAKHEHVRVVSNATNLGFAAGNNQGLALANGDTVLLLNNDTVVTEGWLANMLAVFQRHPEVGIVGPVSNNISGPQRIETGYRSLDEMHPFARQWSAAHQGQSDENFRVVGFCLLARREVIDRIGGLDERYGSGNFEDDDFCIRGLVAGYKARIARDSFVHHFGSQTFKGAGIDYSQSLNRNWELFKTKWNLPQTLAYGQNYFDHLSLPADATAYFISLPDQSAVEALRLKPAAVMLVANYQSGHQPDQAAAWLEQLQTELSLAEQAVLVVDPGGEYLADLPQRVAASYKKPAAALAAALDAGAKYVALISSDVILPPEWFSRLQTVAESDPAIAAIGPVSNAAPAAQQIERGYDDLEEAGLRHFAASRFDEHGNAKTKTLYLGGFCLLLKSHAVKVVGGLDSELSLPEALLDLYGRLKNFGFKRVVAPGVYVHHQELTPDEGAHYDDFFAFQRRVNQVLESGQTALAQNDLERAAAEFAAAAEEHPDLAAVHVALGNTLLALSRAADAVPPLRRAVELVPQEPTIHIQLGKALYQAGQADAAEAAFKHGQQFAPDSIDLLLSLADLYRLQGQYSQAMPLLKQALSSAPDNPDVLIQFGLLMLDIGDLEGAELAWERLGQAEPSHPGTTALLSGLVGRGSRKVGLTDLLLQVDQVQAGDDWPTAIKLLKGVLKQRDQAAWSAADESLLWNRLGVSYFQLGQLAEAGVAFEQGLALVPDDLDLLHNLADLYLKQEEYDQATGYINRALRAKSNDVTTLMMLGNVSIQLGVFDVALMAFQRVQELAPETEGIDQVVRELKTLRDEEPVEAAAGRLDMSGALEQAQAALQAGEWSQATILLKQALAAPEAEADEAIWSQLGYAHFMSGDQAAAEKAFLKTVELDPTHVGALSSLANLYLQQEVFDKGTEYLNRALALTPDDVELLMLLGNTAIQLEAFDVAAMAFEKVQSLAPETEGVGEVLIQLHAVESVS